MAAPQLEQIWALVRSDFRGLKVGFRPGDGHTGARRRARVQVHAVIMSVIR